MLITINSQAFDHLTCCESQAVYTVTYQTVLETLPGSGGRRYVISGNADFQSAVPQISQLLDNLQSTKQHLNQLWSVKKMRLEQCFQLRIFEEDVEKVLMTFSHHIQSKATFFGFITIKKPQNPQVCL